MNLKQMVISSNGFTRFSFSATVTRVSNFVEENVCLFLHHQGSPFRCIQSLIAQHFKCVNRNAFSMLKALNKCFQQKCAFLLYTMLNADLNR